MWPERKTSIWGLLQGLVTASVVLLSAGRLIPFAWGEDSASKDAVTVRKTQEGLNFQVPPDWPIEKRGGIMAPIPIEEYLGRKFKAIEAQLQAIEQRFNGFDVRLRVLEEEVKRRREGLRSLEQPAPSPQAKREAPEGAK